MILLLLRVLLEGFIFIDIVAIPKLGLATMSYVNIFLVVIIYKECRPIPSLDPSMEISLI
jgi:hypothetical protein